MRKQYLHLSAYTCDVCTGPVIAGSLGVRENEISKETEIQRSWSNLPVVWASAGREHRRRDVYAIFFPIEWETVSAIKEGQPKSEVVESPTRIEVH